MSENSYNYGYNNTSDSSNSPKGKKDGEWVSWAIIVTLFAVGVWPVALILLFTKLSDSGQKKKRQAKEQFPPLHTNTTHCQAAAQARETARQATAQAREAARQATEQGREAARQAVEQSKEETRQAVEQSKEAARQAAERARAAAQRAAEQAKAAYAQKSAPETESKAKAAAKKMVKTPAVKSSTAKWMKLGGLLLTIFGAGGMWSNLEPFFLSRNWSTMPTVPEFYLWETLQYTAFAVAGVGLMLKGLSMAREVKRFQKYLSIIGNFEAMSIQQLARKLGYGENRVEKDLLKMIDKGFFGPSAYLNMELGYLFRSGEADANLAREQAAKQQPVTPQEAEAGYSGILRNIRRANDRIADPTLSKKIERLEQIAARIFKAVEDDPKKQSRIDTFLNYYLPTTQKLLDSYAEFESTGIEGENLRQAKERIEATMDSIVEGFEHQLDELYRADFMDVDSDIRVMETMLGRDTASAAKDFGLGQTAKPKGASRTSDIDLGGSAAQRQEE